MKYAFEAESLYVNFGKTPILWDISMQIPPRLLVGIVGPNGAGKSSLLKTAAGIITPLSGKVDLLGLSPEKAKKRIAYVPQRESVDWDFPITALEVVLMGRYGRLGLLGRPSKSDRDAAHKALELVGMGAFSDRQIGQLSGGQQQRIFIARSLVQDCDIFLLDEPFAGVDLTTEKAVVEILRKQRDQNKTVFVVHHDLPSVEEYFDWVILLNTRLIAFGPVKDVFTPENLAAAFGKGESLFNEAAALSAKTISGLL